MNERSDVSVYDRMCWPQGQLEQALAAGAHRRELIAYFGEREYSTLAALARQAASLQRQRARRRPARARAPRREHVDRPPRVYLLPGLMGSQLGWRRAAGEPPDLLWLDPLDIAAGRLTALRWRRGPVTPGGLTPLGVIPHTYLALTLRLAAVGFEVVLHDYDWRMDLAQLAQALATRLAADPAEELVLLGHSMGGLLARAALARCGVHAERITRVIGVGAPYGGSIGAVQALRATYPAILRLAALDHEHDAPSLTTTVFRSFASLYQMLPSSTGRLNLFDPMAWPRPLAARRGRAAPPAPPDRRLLAAARRFAQQLAVADPRFISIIGTGQRTVTGIARRRGQFRYEITDAGDGTVPAVCATLPGARNYSLRCEHSELPRSERVATAVIELSLHGRTRRLREGLSVPKGARVYVTDAMLRRAFDRKLDWQRLTTASRRRYLNQLNAPPALYRPTR